MKKTMIFALSAIFVLFIGRVSADEMAMHDGMKMEKKSPAGKSAKYEVVDVACYVAKGAHGPDHKSCAVKCIGGGGELALLKGGKLYVPVDADFHSARAKFASKAGETVEVSGKAVSKGGVNYLKISE